MIKGILKRIRKIRKQKGYSYENLAHELNISTSAYRKIELNETKLTIERLYQISNALETQLEELLNLSSDKIIRQHRLVHQDIKNLQTKNDETLKKLMEVYEARLKEKDKLIELLKNNKI